MLAGLSKKQAYQNKKRGAKSPVKPIVNHDRTPRPAYEIRQFMESQEARTLRIGAEYLEPQVRLQRAGVRNTVVFFGSARILPRDVGVRNLTELQRRGSQGSGPARAAELRAARMAVEMSRYYEDARELSRLLTNWSLSFQNGKHFLVVCSGGGPGIMEAANRGASEAGGLSIGLNIKLPTEQEPNPYISPDLSFMFRYFFMRKLWFAQPSRALVVFPGGFGTMDELWEFLTLIQTHKIGHRVFVLLYGSRYWRKAINFNWLVETGTVSEDELKIIHFADSPQQAFGILKKRLSRLLHLRQPRYPFI
jgi:uncharacterized protein (TIGR00730 family)